LRRRIRRRTFEGEDQERRNGGGKDEWRMKGEKKLFFAAGCVSNQKTRK
jgi:hypothetical protein